MVAVGSTEATWLPLCLRIAETVVIALLPCCETSEHAPTTSACATCRCAVHNSEGDDSCIYYQLIDFIPVGLHAETRSIGHCDAAVAHRDVGDDQLVHHVLQAEIDRAADRLA